MIPLKSSIVAAGARVELCNDAKRGPGTAGPDPNNRYPSSRTAKRYGDDHGLRAIGGAHGLPMGLAAGQRGQPRRGRLQVTRARSAGRRCAGKDLIA